MHATLARRSTESLLPRRSRAKATTSFILPADGSSSSMYAAVRPSPGRFALSRGWRRDARPGAPHPRAGADDARRPLWPPAPAAFAKCRAKVGRPGSPDRAPVRRSRPGTRRQQPPTRPISRRRSTPLPIRLQGKVRGRSGVRRSLTPPGDRVRQRHDFGYNLRRRRILRAYGRAHSTAGLCIWLGVKSCRARICSPFRMPPS